MTIWTLATLKTPEGARAALGINDRYFILHDLQPLMQGTTSKQILQTWETSLPLLNALVEKVVADDAVFAHGVPAGEADLLTPVLEPDGLFAVGANYSGHLKEMGLAATKWASMPFFIRPPKTTLVGPGDTVIIPKTTKQFDWECELAVFIGKTLKNVSKEEAAAAVAGYAIGLDLSCRDLIKVDNDLKVDLVRGKAQDTMAPCGAVMMPAQFVPDVNNLRIQLFVNEEKMMDASTCEMLYKIDEQISTISEFMTIEAGSILFTGSPSGSAGEHGDRWLKPGDRIHATIENVGSLDVTMRQA